MNEKINIVLDYLWNNARLDWKAEVDEIYPNTNTAAKAKISVVRFTQKNPECVDEVDLPRIIVGSVHNLIKGFFTLLPSEIAEIVEVLKEQKKILQLGAGKGRAFVIFNHKPITVPIQNTYTIDVNDPKALAEAVTSFMQKSVADLEAVKELSKRQDETIRKQSQKIEELNNEVLNKVQKSWT